MKHEMTEKEWTNACEVILAMDRIMHSLNDEDALFNWLGLGVPDGDSDLESIKADYPNDEEFSGWFNDLSALFCRIIARQTISKVVDGRAVLDGNAVLYVGQDVNARM